MDTWVWHQVGLELGKIDVKSTTIFCSVQAGNSYFANVKCVVVPLKRVVAAVARGDVGRE